MPTPRKGYWVGDKRVPSVTTILGTLGWGNENLLSWANNLGLEGKKHTEVRERAADIGTVAHEMIDDLLHGRLSSFPDIAPEIVSEAEIAFGAYQAWAKDRHLRIVESEFPLVSFERMFGGTPDALVEIDGTRVLLDFKTSKYLFAKHVIQVVAYMDLIAECRGIRLERAIVLRVGKDGVFRALDVSGADIEIARAAFDHCLALHKVKSHLEALTRIAAPPGQILTLPTVAKAVPA